MLVLINGLFFILFQINPTSVQQHLLQQEAEAAVPEVVEIVEEEVEVVVAVHLASAASLPMACPG